MNSTRRRVSLSRQHLQKSNQAAAIAYGGHNKSAQGAVSCRTQVTATYRSDEANDALQALEKLGMPRTSSLGESLEQLDDDDDLLTDDDRQSSSQSNTYNGDSTTEGSSFDEAGLVYEFPNRNVGENFKAVDDQLNDNLVIYEYPDEQYYSTNSGANSPVSNSSTICLTLNNDQNYGPEDNGGGDYDCEYYTSSDGLNETDGEILDDAKSWAKFQTAAGGEDRSSAESGCDTEDTVKAAAVSDDEHDDNDPWNLKLGSINRENLESGFTEDYIPGTPSVYEEEAVINISRDDYNDSDSDIEEPAYGTQNKFLFNRSDVNSSVPYNPGYLESNYNYRRPMSNEGNSCYSHPSSFVEECDLDEEKYKKHRLQRRPHIKATQSPLLRRRRFGEEELELVRPSKTSLEESQIQSQEEDEEENDEDVSENEEIEVENECSPLSRSRFSFLRNVSGLIENKIEQQEEDIDCDSQAHQMVPYKNENELQVDDADAECFTMMERTIQLELTHTKWAKTKEQIMKLLKERLIVLKKVIQDKNCQIRQLKIRLKAEQQNSLAAAQKMMVRIINYISRQNICYFSLKSNKVFYKYL